MYKLFLIRRYLRKRLIAMFAILSVWLCVFMVIVVISVMGGFVNMVREHSRGLLSDLIVDNATLQGFPYYQEFIETMLVRMPDTVVAATPVIYNYGIMRITRIDYTKPVQVVGVRLGEYKAINAFGGSLYYDRHYPGTTDLKLQRQPFLGFTEKGTAVLPPEFEQAWSQYRTEHPEEDVSGQEGGLLEPFSGPGLFEAALDGPGFGGDERPGVVLGVDLFCDRAPSGEYIDGTPLGSELIVTVLPLTRKGTISGEGPIPLAMRYADRSRTRVYDIDKMCVYVDLDVLQNALGMEPKKTESGSVVPARTSQVLVKLAPGHDLGAAREKVTALWQEFAESRNVPAGSAEDRLMAGVTVETWEERQRAYIDAVEKEKALVTILFGIICVVAVFLIGCIFYMIVSNKTRDIGIIKSVGASSAGVASIFIGFGLAVGVVGSILGTVSSVLFVWKINEMQDLLIRLDPRLQVWSPSVYVFDRIPSTVDPTEVGIIVIAAIVASVVGALIPAILAGRVWPVEALRYE
ncbi:MAG: ABC transporter permease [bacterium]|nr:ABC transporter permease [bacterium]